MKVEEKRIFISDLPETATEKDIKDAFNIYGNVISIEIKERKELGPKNSSLFFAYINIDIDDRNLQKCFKDFSNEKWHGSYLYLQIARENFLDRLKRERNESENKTKTDNSFKQVPQSVSITNISNGIKSGLIKKYVSSESESSDSGEDFSTRNNEKEHNTLNNITSRKLGSSNSSSSESNKNTLGSTNETIDIVIKNNKGKLFDKNGLKIESVGNKPIITIDRSKKKMVNSSEANLKRLQSLNNLRKGYHTQKSLIQAALSNIDNNSKNKIVFDENIVNAPFKRSNQVKQSQISLFNDEPNEEDEFEPNFNLKEQFQGYEGQKLLELQSRFKNDKRFALDARFLDKTETGLNKNMNGEKANEDESLEEEKQKEYEILEQVLGKKVNPRYVHQESKSQMKGMLRFDPTQPEHSKYEIKKELGKQKKRKRNDSEPELLDEKKQDEVKVPVVSKETFYKVTDNLKERLHEKQEFSLLSIFGERDEREESDDVSAKELDANNIPLGRNPFRYDSSDEEDETDHGLNKDQPHTEKSLEPVQMKVNRSFWTEPTFLANDDYRFQDGFDFFEGISEENNVFIKLRRDLKVIVKGKVRNNQRKNKPFKKKLGNSKRKKMIKMKKALKR